MTTCAGKSHPGPEEHTTAYGGRTGTRIFLKAPVLMSRTERINNWSIPENDACRTSVKAALISQSSYVEPILPPVWPALRASLGSKTQRD